MLELINIDTNRLYKNQNGADMMKISENKKTDNYIKAKQAMYDETDPNKRQTMINRLASGITDFSDL